MVIVMVSPHVGIILTDRYSTAGGRFGQPIKSPPPSRKPGAGRGAARGGLDKLEHADADASYGDDVVFRRRPHQEFHPTYPVVDGVIEVSIVVHRERAGPPSIVNVHAHTLVLNATDIARARVETDVRRN